MPVTAGDYEHRVTPQELFFDLVFVFAFTQVATLLADDPTFAREPVTVDADLSLGQFMDDVASSRRYTTYPVLEDGSPIGLLAFRSVASVPRDRWNERHVRDAMIPRHEMPMLAEDDAAIDALVELSESDLNRGLVVDNGRLAGLLSITDLARALETRRPARPLTARTPGRAP